MRALELDQKHYIDQRAGEVAEWLKAPHSKCGILARVSGVRIPPSPPVKLKSLVNFQSLALYPHRKTHNPLSRRFPPPWSISIIRRALAADAPRASHRR